MLFVINTFSYSIFEFCEKYFPTIFEIKCDPFILFIKYGFEVATFRFTSSRQTKA